MYIRVDSINRITIPAELRRTCSINTGEKIGIKIVNGEINISKEFDEDSLIRKVDLIGRFQIPTAIRQSLGIVQGSMVRYRVRNKGVYISRSDLHCVTCGGIGVLNNFRDLIICDSCVDEIKNNKYLRAD